MKTIAMIIIILNAAIIIGSIVLFGISVQHGKIFLAIMNIVVGAANLFMIKTNIKSIRLLNNRHV